MIFQHSLDLFVVYFYRLAAAAVVGIFLHHQTVARRMAGLPARLGQQQRCRRSGCSRDASGNPQPPSSTAMPMIMIFHTDIVCCNRIKPHHFRDPNLIMAYYSCPRTACQRRLELKFRLIAEVG